MDYADHAQDAETVHRAAALSLAGGNAAAGDQIRENGVIVCRDCGEPIPGARLRILPTACRCVACQEAVEAVQC
ncbi:transcriptional regulator, TraR/DksA family [Solidesulfovibrio fructosivorans JJ]]|uniref:Transcriptional regulator, TraR/DksA family n=1 Tax=Solidesulfovibrio fructosivorans JJ] TaxID=596151 RepID=E1JR08_SOLFR|nr:TraR/DksA C4-type zinc finger protein [Solidesulfovibrio fructosivorans]EFL53009.1 transcriptional regulator, TraR/DksA family [Solidesulfovibrio fructosivorans JJ]]